MVALAIFAILGVLSYRALAEVATSNSRLEENFEAAVLVATSASFRRARRRMAKMARATILGGGVFRREHFAT